MLYNNILAHNVQKTPNHIAVIFKTQSLSYAELDRNVAKVASNLHQKGLQRGQRVCSYLPNCLENLILTLACFKIGAVSVPIRATLQAKQIEPILTQAKPKIVVTNERLLPEIQPLLRAEVAKYPIQYFVVGTPHHTMSFSRLLEDTDAEIPMPEEEEDLPATILYTSGSTGDPKGAVHTQQQWWANTVLSARNYQPGDATYVALSINHAYGFGEQILPALASGATLVLHDRFDPNDFIESVINGVEIGDKKMKITSFYGVPSMYAAIAQKNPTIKAHSLHYLDAAGDVLPEVVKQKLIDIFGHIVRPSYGMSEAMCIAVSRPDQPLIPAVLGTLRSGIEFKLLNHSGESLENAEEGELAIKGKTVCTHYLHCEPSETHTRDGYLRTGDYVRINRDLQLSYINRVKRIIITEGGYNINPRDIENVIESHPRVNASCAFDITDATGQSLIVALATLLPGAENVSAKLIFDLFAKVNPQHAPSIVSIIDKFQLGSTGKIDWRFHKAQAEQSNQTHQPNSATHFDVKSGL